MSFVIRNLSVSAYNNGFTLWHYKAGRDTIAQVCEDNYMEPAVHVFSTGDCVIISAADGAAIRHVTATADPSHVMLTPLL